MGGKPGGGELAGGDIDVSQPYSILTEDQADQVVIGLALQQAGFDHRARGHQADHLPFHQPFAFAGSGHLLADSNLVAAADEPRQVVIQGVVGNARHRHLVSLAHTPRGQDNLQLAGGELGILVKGLVEIAQAEEHNGVGVLLLDF